MRKTPDPTVIERDGQLWIEQGHNRLILDHAQAGALADRLAGFRGQERERSAAAAPVRAVVATVAAPERVVAGTDATWRFALVDATDDSPVDLTGSGLRLVLSQRGLDDVALQWPGPAFVVADPGAGSGSATLDAGRSAGLRGGILRWALFLDDAARGRVSRVAAGEAVADAGSVAR